MIISILQNEANRLAHQFGWAISSVRIDTTFSGRALLDIKPIIDKTLGGETSKKVEQINDGVEQISFTPPPHQIIPLTPCDIKNLEANILQTAYQLGAYDCCRYSYSKNYEALNVYFGGITNKQFIMDDPILQSQIQIIDINEIESIINEADQFGFLSYLFKPTALASEWQKKHWISQDASLNPTGKRNNICVIAQDNFFKKRNFVFGKK